MRKRSNSHGFIFAAALVACSPLAADVNKEQPVGVVLASSASKLLRSDTETPLSAKVGDILFAGDAVKTEGGSASLLYCPAKSSVTLPPGSDVRLDASQIKVRAGALSGEKKVASCFLPQMVRVSASSQQHYGTSITRGLNKPEEPAPVSRDKLPADVVTELAPFDSALASDPKDMAAIVGRAVVFEKHELLQNALLEYNSVAKGWPEAVWVKGKIFELQEAIASAAAKAAGAKAGGGKTFALLVGISKYQKLPQEQWLQYANADATIFADHLRSGRGGAVPADNILLLTDEKATTAALRNAFETFLKGRAGKNDTVMILIAAHGTVETPGNKGAYIVTYDSDPQDLGSTALPMADIQKLSQNQLSNVGRVAIFIDVCRAGTIGTIKSTGVNTAVEKLGEAEGELLGLMASRPKELSFEGKEYGGGHGAFSYYLLKALEGDADRDKDGKITAGELIDYAREKVPGATENKQHPRDFGTMDNAVVLSDLSKPGIQLSRWERLRGADGEPLYFAAAYFQEGAAGPDRTRDLERLQEAIKAGRILPDEPDGAFAALRVLKNELAPEQYMMAANQLRVELENRAQQILLRYLSGDQVPQLRKDFDMAARYTSAAASLTPESLFLQGREAFFKGRTLLFDRSYVQSMDLLEDSVRIDPGGAYAYNALGISYLEQAQYEKAIPAFHDAIRRAPQWAYPLHNLALSYTESGDYSAAIASYQKAMRLSPRYSYLPYNLGLVYQRLNRRKDAEASYRKAMALAPDAPEPYNALGALKDSIGKSKEAEALYRQALTRNSKFLAARQNLALLLSRQKDRQNEALQLWRANLADDPGYLPSRLSLAQQLAQSGDAKTAIQEYEEILKQKPDYVAAHAAVADLLIRSGDYEKAKEHLDSALNKGGQSVQVLERMGDLEAAQKRPAEARTAYESALRVSTDPSERKRLHRKLKETADIVSR